MNQRGLCPVWLLASIIHAVAVMCLVCKLEFFGLPINEAFECPPKFIVINHLLLPSLFRRDDELSSIKCILPQDSCFAVMTCHPIVPFLLVFRNRF